MKLYFKYYVINLFIAFCIFLFLIIAGSFVNWDIEWMFITIKEDPKGCRMWLVMITILCGVIAAVRLDIKKMNEQERKPYNPTIDNPSLAPFITNTEDSKTTEEKSNREKFINSTLIGAVTGSSLIGGVVGGDILGGLVGDFIEGTEDTPL